MVTQRVDSNPLTQLLVTDLGGMVLPRTGLELYERGPDMGRETFIREITGTLSNVFLAGWVGLLALLTWNGKLLNNRFFRTNKLGINTGAWINARSMDTYGRLFADSLNNPALQTPAAVRRHFVETLLTNMRATDGYQADKAFSGGIEALKDKHPEIAGRMEKLALGSLREGRLSPEVVSQLADMLSPSDDVHRGVYNIEKQIAQFRKLNGRYGPILKQAEALRLSDDLLKTLPETHGRRLALLQVLDPLVKSERIALSRQAMKSMKPFLNELTETAVRHGLSGEIHVLDEAGNAALKNRSLSTTLQEVKFFLEQYADRVLVDPKTGELGNTPMTEAFRRDVMNKLYGRGGNGLLAKFLPTAKDGLITFTRKSKTWLTMIPYALAIVFSISVAFLNNWLTERKHGGKVFFPGDGVVPDDGKTYRKITGGEVPLHTRPGGPFALFEQQRRMTAAGGGR